MTDHPGTSFHPGGLGRALEQALTLRRAVRTQIGVAGLVDDRSDHPGTARGFCGGFLFAAVEAVLETKARPGFGELVSAPTNPHSPDDVAILSALDTILI